MEGIYSSPAYKCSRVAYYIQCVTEYLVTLLVVDAFLAKLLKHIGLDDASISGGYLLKYLQLNLYYKHSVKFFSQN